MFERIFERNKTELESISRKIAGDSLDPLLGYMEGSGFYCAPASRTYHDSYPGGLYDHCKRLYSELYSLRGKMNKNWTDLEMIIISFGHDLCKSNLYIPSVNNFEVTYSYNPQEEGKDHGTESLSILANLIPNLINKRVANSIICHMGLWTKDIPEIGKYMLEAQTEDDLVFFTHSADMVSSRQGANIKNVILTEDYSDIASIN